MFLHREKKYKLTWTEPEGQLYTKNGYFSAYRIVRQSLGNSKIYIFQTPEPICEDGTCTLVLRSRNEPKGYKWTVEARCSKTHFESGNSVICAPDAAIDAQPISDEKPSRKPTNRQSLHAGLLIPIMFLGGILAVILLFQDMPSLAGILLLAIAIGCIVSIVKGIQGIREIKESNGKQRGGGLSVFAILGSILGLFFTGLLMWFVLIY